MNNMQQFVADRREALLSMDREIIEAYMRKYGVRIPNDEEVFWIMIHKARTGATDLSMAARITSKQWLSERGMRSMDDGDVPVQLTGKAIA